MDIDFQRWSGDCQPNNGACPGGGGVRLGCGAGSPSEVPEICPDGRYGFENAFGLGRCDCNNRTFINEECSVGLQCKDDLPPEVAIFHDGCLKACSPSQVLLPDLSDPEGWTCAPAPANSCSGIAYEAPCDGELVGVAPDIGDCIRDGDIIVGDTCTSGVYCDAGGGYPFASCAAGNVLVVTDPTANPPTFTCESTATHTCPPGGGYRYGSYTAPSTTTTTTQTTTSETTTSTPPVGEDPLDCIVEQNQIGVCDGCTGQARNSTIQLKNPRCNFLFLWFFFRLDVIAQLDKKHEFLPPLLLNRFSSTRTAR